MQWDLVCQPTLKADCNREKLDLSCSGVAPFLGTVQANISQAAHQDLHKCPTVKGRTLQNLFPAKEISGIFDDVLMKVMKSRKQALNEQMQLQVHGCCFETLWYKRVTHYHKSLLWTPSMGPSLYEKPGFATGDVCRVTLILENEKANPFKKSKPRRAERWSSEQCHNAKHLEART